MTECPDPKCHAKLIKRIEGNVPKSWLWRISVAVLLPITFALVLGWADSKKDRMDLEKQVKTNEINCRNIGDNVKEIKGDVKEMRKEQMEIMKAIERLSIQIRRNP